MSVEIVKVKCWRENKNIPLPKYAKNGDACCDLYAQSIEYDERLDRYIVHTGLHIALEKGYECQIRPRSSLTKTEFYIANTPGIVDSGYRGEILVVFKSRTDTILYDSLNSIKIALEQINEDIKSLNVTNCITNLELDLDTFQKLNILPFKKGDRIAQLLIQKISTIEWDEVNSLEDLGQTERGAGGYGYTGK